MLNKELRNGDQIELVLKHQASEGVLTSLKALLFETCVVNAGFEADYIDLTQLELVEVPNIGSIGCDSLCLIFCHRLQPVSLVKELNQNELVLLHFAEALAQRQTPISVIKCMRTRV